MVICEWLLVIGYIAVEMFRDLVTQCPGSVRHEAGVGRAQGQMFSCYVQYVHGHTLYPRFTY